MKNPLILFLLCSLSLPCQIMAQVTLTLETQYDKYIKNESVMASISVVNEGYKPLILREGKGKTKLELTVFNSARKELERTTTPLLPQPIEINPGETVEIDIDLRACFKLYDFNGYRARATLQDHDLRFQSNQTFFDIVRGETINTKVFPEDNKVIRLKLINRNQQQNLLLEVADVRTESIMGVFNLGRVLSITEPQWIVTPDGLLHILQRATAQQYIYTAFRLEEGTLSQSIYKSASTVAPYMIKEGTEVVVQGARKVPVIKPATEQITP